MNEFKGLKALVVEDDRVIQTIIISNLGFAGIKAIAVGNGVDAIKTLKEHPFDFVLMDINMPEQDGLDATRWIRDTENKANKQVPIFALTTYRSPQHTEEIILAGMNEHLIKPFNLNDLLKILDKYFPSVKE